MSGFRGKAKPIERTVTTPAGRVRIAIPEGLAETAGERTAYLKGFEAGARVGHVQGQAFQARLEESIAGAPGARSPAPAPHVWPGAKTTGEALDATERFNKRGYTEPIEPTRMI